MGCDIHICVEKKDGTQWVSCDELITDKHGYHSIEKPVYTGRHYPTFAVLAGAHAWLEHDQKYPLKGFPTDASDNTNKLHLQLIGDAHHESYLTLKELEAVDWDKEWILRVHDLTEKQIAIYDYMIKKHRDKCGVFEKGRFVLDSMYVIPWQLYPLLKTSWFSLMEMIYDDFPVKFGETKEVLLAVPLNLICPRFYNDVIRNLWGYAKHYGDPENVRIVFWFDN